MPIKYPDYENCLANLACSVLKGFGIEPPNGTYKPADELLSKEYLNVILLLLDGMGTNIMERHLSVDGFFKSHFRGSLSSTFPPTTVAATTAIRSGLFPNQSCWIGWVGYFGQLDRNIVYFEGRDHDNSSVTFSKDPASTIYPYKSIVEQINEIYGEAHFVSPFAEPHPHGLGEILSEVRKRCQSPNRKYIYAYCDQPDYSLHIMGGEDKYIGELLTDFEGQVEALAEQVRDSLIIVTADHGHTPIINKTITDYPDICECLVRMPSIEPRAVNLFVKPERMADFPELFNKHFGDDFILFSKQEVLDKKLFGTSENDPRFEEMLGDYLAAAIGNVALNTYDKKYKSHHAGLTSDEMNVPFIVIET
ncbi:MAG: alkaline phosphatase family protein [Ruminococcus sp.]|nr:alkaline phosphatase family protein [Ruminococcus sp.]